VSGSFTVSSIFHQNWQKKARCGGALPGCAVRPYLKKRKEGRKKERERKKEKEGTVGKMLAPKEIIVRLSSKFSFAEYNPMILNKHSKYVFLI
jgi:hypothetical protein